MSNRLIMSGRRALAAILPFATIAAALFGAVLRDLYAQQPQVRGPLSFARRHVPPKQMRLPQESPLPAYTIMHVSPYGSDLNDGTGWGTPKATIEGALKSCSSAGVVCRILVAPGTYRFSSTIQLPVNTPKASCRIEGSSSAGAQGTGSNTLLDERMTLLEYIGSGVAIDQTFTDARYQNSLGCQLSHLVLDGRQAGSGAIGVRFAGTLNFTLDDVQVSNFSGPRAVGVQGFNSAPGIFTEQWRFNDLRISNDTTGIQFTRSAANSVDFGHGYADVLWNEFSRQTGLALSDASVYDSILINNGNFSGYSCTGISVSASSSTGSGNDWVYWGAENDGSCTRFSAANGADFDVSGIASGTGSWVDSGKITFEGNKSGHWKFPNLSIGSGRPITSTGAGGTIASVGPNGISAGVIELASGFGSHAFTISYDSKPVCTASDTNSLNPVKVTSTPAMILVEGSGSDVIAWTCSPAAN